ncbi:hypothetical protein DNU06_06235 [Putridiphycobacter roseus]|uniref:Outer membrane protein beta-barrel domain-containing protein n=1 Tax=Putridiphycobacter roseus TaxID=2219161 RepID=A0A2W1N3Q6_9FLAO|nr:outer membrane beta-barrel family protein [Putridiphycobacter roseus]PZE18210.1 hypothetical protein DNU06_06235 [Putridiphycobacter roseus]
MKNFLLLFALLFSISSFSQKVHVKGIVLAEADVLPLANVAVFRTADSLFVKGAYLDSNAIDFSFNAGGKTNYFIKLTLPGYSDKIIDLLIDDTLVNLGIVTPEQNKELAAVDVVFTKEMYTRTMDGVTVNVEGTNLQTLTNLFEVLKASPKITSPDDINIEIIGRGSPLILVDRQAIISNDELKAIPANQIEKIEIITNPSAKYKAQGSGNGVIEVFTKNFHLEGYNMTVSGSGGVNTQLKPTAGLSLGLSLKKKKFSLNGYLGGNYNSSNGFGTTDGVTTDDSNRGLNSVTSFESQNTWQYYNVKGAYNLNEKQRITMGVNGYGSNGKNVNTSAMNYLQNDLITTSSIANSTNAWTWLNNSAFINYTVDTDTNKSNFEINLNYVNKISNSDNASISNFENISTNNTTSYAIRNDSKDIPNIGELRMNYEHIFDTTGWELGVGVSYSALINGKSLNRFNDVNGDWEIDETQSNAYDYTENIGAVFVEVTKNWDKISARAGLRTEYTNLNGFSKSLNKEFIDSLYIIPFPSASIMYQASDKVAVTVSYDAGIDRPQFDNYDPFVVQSDSLRIDYGNPFLRPAIQQTIGLDFDLFYKYNLSLSYTHEKDPMSSVSFIKDNSFLTETTPWNAEAVETFSSSISVPFQLKWLTGWNSVWVNYAKYTFTPIFGRETFTNLTYGLYSYLTFKLPKSFDITNRFHVNKWGGSTSVNKVVVNWGLRATKKFNGNKFQLYFDLGNIIPPKYASETYSGNYIYNSTSQNQFTTFKLGFFMKFGRLKAPTNIQESKSNQGDRI